MELPDWIPLKCRQAANQIAWIDLYEVYQGERQRILGHPDLKDFWLRLDLLCSGMTNAQDFYCELLVRLIAKGGALPPKDLGKKRKHCKNIATQVHKLRNLIAKDEHVCRLDWLTLLDLSLNSDSTVRALNNLHVWSVGDKVAPDHRIPHYDEQLPEELPRARDALKRRIGNPTAYTRVSAVVSLWSTACWTSSRTGWSARWGKPSRGKRWKGNFRV
jgi:hypothetical protein